MDGIITLKLYSLYMLILIDIPYLELIDYYNVPQISQLSNLVAFVYYNKKIYISKYVFVVFDFS